MLGWTPNGRQSDGAEDHPARLRRPLTETADPAGHKRCLARLASTKSPSLQPCVPYKVKCIQPLKHIALLRGERFLDYSSDPAKQTGLAPAVNQTRRLLRKRTRPLLDHGPAAGSYATRLQKPQALEGEYLAILNRTECGAKYKRGSRFNFEWSWRISVESLKIAPALQPTGSRPHENL